VLLAFDAAGLVESARRAGAVVRLVHLVGDFVSQGETLFEVFGAGEAVSADELRRSVVFGANA